MLQCAAAPARRVRERRGRSRRHREASSQSLAAASTERGRRRQLHAYDIPRDRASASRDEMTLPGQAREPTLVYIQGHSTYLPPTRRVVRAEEKGGGGETPVHSPPPPPPFVRRGPLGRGDRLLAWSPNDGRCFHVEPLGDATVYSIGADDPAGPPWPRRRSSSTTRGGDLAPLEREARDAPSRSGRHPRALRTVVTDASTSADAVRAEPCARAAGEGVHWVLFPPESWTGRQRSASSPPSACALGGDRLHGDTVPAE